MSVLGLASAIVPQSHGSVEDFEGKDGKSNVSYDTLRIRDPKANETLKTNHSYNVIGHTNYMEKLIASEESALDTFLKDAQSNINTPKSYLGAITDELSMIRQENLDSTAEVRSQNIKEKELEFRERNIATAEKRVSEQQDLVSNARENRIQSRVLTDESIKQNRENKATNDQVIKDSIDVKAMEKNIWQEDLSERVIQEKIIEDEAAERILQAREMEKISTNEIVEKNVGDRTFNEVRARDIIDDRVRENQIKEEVVVENLGNEDTIVEEKNIEYMEVREQVVQVREVQNTEDGEAQYLIEQEKMSEAKSLKDKRAGIEYTENPVIIEENSLVAESANAVENANNVNMAEPPEDNPEMLQMSFGVNLVI